MASNNMSLTDRMKEYENAFQYTFTKRTPLIVRIDGKAFSTWTKDLNRPFDKRMSLWMQNTLSYLVNNIQGCAFGFTVSDEISLFIRDWDKLNTNAWFDGNLQKIVSISASMATAAFNAATTDNSYGLPSALFDARAFVIPKDEVVNYFIYRQHDGIRNSVQMHAQHLFGHKAIQGIKNADLKVKIAEKFPDNKWEDLPSIFRNGCAIRRDEDCVTTEVPLFKDDRQYIEELIYIKGE